MRRPLHALLAAITLVPAPARAEEPLFLRIRPAATPDLADADAAFARREAVWARSAARARIAIASVCTGCMRPMPRADAPPFRRHDLTGIVPESDPRLGNDSIPPAIARATVLATAGVP